MFESQLKLQRLVDGYKWNYVGFSAVMDTSTARNQAKFGQGLTPVTKPAHSKRNKIFGLVTKTIVNRVYKKKGEGNP
jgi:hypothetical protein